MKLSRTPDFGPWRRMILVALAAAAVAVVTLAVQQGYDLDYRLGDTDDAMRLVMMRGLLEGHGWYDQLVTRLQPPHGVYMHWSRLIDGGLAALDSLFRLFASPEKAELATRFVWPLLWAFPAAVAAAAVARRLGAGTAVLVCAVIMAVNLPMMMQFRPGRIDHHNVQIVMAVTALAGAALAGARGAAVAGIATGLGLAIGLEALAFDIAVGAYFALRYPLGDERNGRELSAYGLALALSTAGFFLVQTPPWRWGVAACDALAVNLTAAIAVTGLGLAALCALGARRDWRFRLAGLAVVGAVAAALYVALDPNCLNGPFADVDPQLKVFWLPNVQEIRPVTRVWRSSHEVVLTLAIPMALGAAAWIWLALAGERRRDGFLYLAGACLVASSIAGLSAVRMGIYANWFAAPLIAAAVAGLADRYARGALLAAAAGACVATPVLSSGAVVAIDNAVKNAAAKPSAKAQAVPKPAPKPAARRARPVRGDRCFRAAAFADLARQPAGIVLSEIDLGPFVLAHTPSSAMAAPYHRMNWGLLQSRAVLSTEAEAAEAGARRLGTTYVLECPTHKGNSDRVGMKADSLQKRLDAGKPPSWLEPVSVNGPVRVYRVKPAGS